MSVEPEIVNIEDFFDYNKKSDAEFAAAIGNIEIARNACIKKIDFVGAYKLLKLQIKLENLAIKKGIEKDRREIKEIMRKH